MMCPFCKKHNVSVAILQTEGESVFELGLCEFCAKKFNLFEGACPSIQALASKLETGEGGGALAGGGASGAASGPARSLPRAGSPGPGTGAGSETAQPVQFPATLTEKLKNFQKTGRLSGPEDYAALEAQLKMLFQKIQGGAQHTGKAPHASKDTHVRNNQRAELEAELAAAVKAEQYEKAAELRDRIRKLEELPPR